MFQMKHPIFNSGMFYLFKWVKNECEIISCAKKISIAFKQYLCLYVVGLSSHPKKRQME